MSKTENKSKADLIWESIKDKPINVYALPRQTVQDHVYKLAVPGDQLLVTLKSTAVLPALEEAVKDDYEVEAAEKYTIVREKQKPLDVSKLIEK